MPTLTTADGAPVEPPVVDPEQVNRDFSRAMAASEPDLSTAPPRVDPPAEPAGGRPRRGRGRPRKDPADKPRVTDKPVEPPAGPVDKDYTEQCAGLTTLAWATLAAVPPTSPYACVIEMSQNDLVTALNAGCQQNPKVRAAVEKWSSGSGGVWALQLGAVAVNMSVSTLQLLKDPALRAEAREHTQDKFRGFLRANGVKLPGDEPGPESTEPETSNA
jgi:hypothetical protein